MGTGTLKERGASLHESLEHIEPIYPYLIRFKKDNIDLIKDKKSYLIKRSNDSLLLINDGGQGSPLMCDILEKQIADIFPTLRTRIGRVWDNHPEEVSIIIGAYETELRIDHKSIKVPLEQARMLLPTTYSEEQINYIDRELGFHAGQNNVGLTSVRPHEVKRDFIKWMLDSGSINKFVIFPYMVHDSEDIAVDLQEIGISTARLSMGGGSENTQALIVDTYGLISTILQSRSIKTTIAGAGHNPTESLMSGCNTLMIPDKTYGHTTATAENYPSLQLVDSNRDAWRILSNYTRKGKDYRFRDAMLQLNYDKYSNFMRRIVDLI